MTSLINPIPDTAELVFNGVRSRVYQWDQEMYDGSISRFERIRFLDAAFVVPMTPEGKIILTLQEQPTREAFISFPGGAFDFPEEEPSVCALRELREETGYATDELFPWQVFGGTSNVVTSVYYFIARNCLYIGPIEPDSGEKIEVFFVTFDELLSLSSDVRLHHHWNLLPILYEARLDQDKRQALYDTFYGKQ